MSTISWLHNQPRSTSRDKLYALAVSPHKSLSIVMFTIFAYFPCCHSALISVGHSHACLSLRIRSPAHSAHILLFLLSYWGMTNEMPQWCRQGTTQPRAPCNVSRSVLKDHWLVWGRGEETGQRRKRCERWCTFSKPLHLSAVHWCREIGH